MLTYARKQYLREKYYDPMTCDVKLMADGLKAVEHNNFGQFRRVMGNAISKISSKLMDNHEYRAGMMADIGWAVVVKKLWNKLGGSNELLLKDMGPLAEYYSILVADDEQRHRRIQGIKAIRPDFVTMDEENALHKTMCFGNASDDDALDAIGTGAYAVFNQQEKNVANTDNMYKVETLTLVGGQPAKNLSDDELFNAIHVIEGQIKHLEAIETKPKKLLAKIDDLKKGIADLVALVDSRE